MALQSQLGITESIFVGSTMAAGMPAGDPLIQNVAQSLGITHQLDLDDGTKAVAQSLGITDQVTVNFDLAIGVTQNINMAQSNLPAEDVFDPMGIATLVEIELLIFDQQNVVHTLDLTQEVDAGTVQNIVQNLNLSQQVDVINFGPIEQNLFIHDIVDFIGPTYISVSNTIALVDVVGVALPVQVTHVLGITDEANSVEKDVLNLTHVAMAYLNASPFFVQELGISDVVQVSAAYVANVSHTNIIEDAVTFWIEDGTGCPRMKFNDWGDTGPKPLTISVKDGAKMSLRRIEGSSATLVLLRNPELDDRDRLGYQRINRETRGGELQIFSDPSWPIINTLQATVIGLKPQDVDDYLQFMEDTLGEEISLSDWHGRYWRGVILNPGEPVVEDTLDRWTLQFEFEGVVQDGPDVFENIGLTDLLEYIAVYTRSITHNLGLTQTVDPGLANVHHDGFNVEHDGFEVFHTN